MLLFSRKEMYNTKKSNNNGCFIQTVKLGGYQALVLRWIATCTVDQLCSFIARYPGIVYHTGAYKHKDGWLG